MPRTSGSQTVVGRSLGSEQGHSCRARHRSGPSIFSKTGTYRSGPFKAGF